MASQPAASNATSSWILLAVGVAILAWTGAIVQGGFVLDDREAIFDNPVVNGDLGLVEAFRRDYWHHTSDAGHYRPLATLSLRLDHALWGRRAAGYHLTNLFLHVLVVALAGGVLARTAGVGGWAFFGLLVLASHPAIADSVAWISGRTSMLSAAGGLLACLAVLLARQWPAAVFGVAGGLLLGLFGKEDAIVFALPVLLLAFLRPRSFRLAAVVGGVLALGVYLAMRAHALGSAMPSAPHAPLADLGFVDRLAFAGRGLLEAIRLVFFPVAYPPTYRLAMGFCVGAPPGLVALLGWLPWIALVAGGGAAAVSGLLRRNAKRVVVGSSLAVAALSLLPVLQIVPAGEVFAPRFLYLPLLFLVPAIGALVTLLPRVLIVLLVGLLVVLAWDRSAVYGGREAWNQEVLQYVPRDVGALNDWGLAREEIGDVEGAAEKWLLATRLDPSYSRAWSNLGRLWLAEGETERAEAVFRMALKAGPRNPVAHVNLAALLLREQHYDQAEALYRDALALSRGFLPAWRGLGRALQGQGRLDEARAAYEQALRLGPRDEITRQLLRTLPPDESN